ncbi:MAG: type I-U CRISPR-associated protein Csb2, partial [Planctomycetota bacterium]
MITIKLAFPANRYHATPWGRHVNEGAVEWPPSPWRFLRALVSVWRYKFPNVAESDMSALTERLCEPPSFKLPNAMLGHSRHYMPTSQNPAKVLDTFVVLPTSHSDAQSEAVFIHWAETVLSPDQSQLLSQLLGAMTYFGRAESWVEAELVDDWSGQCNAMPRSSSPIDQTQCIQRLLVPETRLVYEQWRSKRIAAMQQAKLEDKQRKAAAKGKATDRIKLSAKELASIAGSLPTSTLDTLHVETNQLRQSGWNRPPGSRWLEYTRPAKAFDRPKAIPRIQTSPTRPTIARYAIAGSAVPRLTQAVRIGDRARRHLMGCSRKVNANNGRDDAPSTVLSGKNRDGRHRIDQHAHAH